jgi:hypothetical protein
MRHLFPLTAFSGGGRTLPIPDVDAYHAFARGRLLGEHLAGMRRVWCWRTHEYVDRDVTDAWFVRDAAGRVVVPGAFGDPATLRAACRRRGDFEHRGGPVPFCGKRCHQRHDAPRKRHGGRGVVARARAFHAGDPLRELDA